MVSAEGETIVTYWATDRAGNRSTSRTLTVRVDTTLPSVTQATPKGKKVGPRANVTATFSETMDPDTLQGTTFTLTKKGTAAPVPARVAYSSAPAAKATLNPARKLKAGATYTAEITTGATDEAGNALAANKVWTFTVKQ